MPYLPTAQSFLDQSRLLVSARPTTTRITSKYSLPKRPNPAPTSDTPISAAKITSLPPPENSQSRQPPKATLTLKTYDPASGTCLKYQTDKAAEVGRLVALLASCGRKMAALPDKEEGAVEVEEVIKEEPEVKAKVAQKEGGKDVKGQGKGGDKGGGGGGGGRKKKGKK